VFQALEVGASSSKPDPGRGLVSDIVIRRTGLMVPPG
jgi:hypothetical protein